MILDTQAQKYMLWIDLKEQEEYFQPTGEMLAKGWDGKFHAMITFEDGSAYCHDCAEVHFPLVHGEKPKVMVSKHLASNFECGRLICFRSNDERRACMAEWTAQGEGLREGLKARYVCSACLRPVNGVYRLKPSSSRAETWVCAACRSALVPKQTSTRK